jgi:predicted acetyltransferase
LTGLELRPITPQELPAYVRSLRRTYGAHSPRQEELALSPLITEFDRTLAAFDDGHVVATSGVFSFQIAVPGGLSLPCAGVTRVTVLSTHRRRGLLTAMMRRMVDEARRRGEPLAALFASEAPIYGRFGYGVAAYDVEIEIARARSAFAQPLEGGGRVRMLDATEAPAIFTDVWNRAQPAQPGMLRHSEAWWRHDLADLEAWREGESEQYLAIYEDAGGRAQGVAQYRVKSAWTDNQPDGTLTVHLLVGVTTEATAALWRHCLDVDLMARVHAWQRRVDDPVRFLLQDTRAARLKLNDSLWLRLVDVSAALAGRRYLSPGSLVLEVRDGFCPWNQRRYRLETGGGSGSCEATDAACDLVIDAGDLAAVYLGGTAPTALADAGRIEERSKGALERADTLFMSERTPWCPSHF